MCVPKLTSPGARRRQCGAVSVLVAIAIVMLVTTLGLVLDLGHLYIAKAELQNAADACALGAVWEISPYNSGSGDRARAAGQTIASHNRYEFQSRAVAIADDGITFADAIDGPYTVSATTTTRYVRCNASYPAGSSVAMWIMGLWGIFGVDLSASAVAGVQLCGFPLAFCSSVANPGATPNFGFTPGSWYGGRPQPGGAVTGNFNWLDFGDLETVICGSGLCTISENFMQQVVVDPLPGNKATKAAHAFNTRFGLYEGSQATRDPQQCRPDWTGYTYTWYPAATPPVGSWAPPSGTESACAANAQLPSCNAYSNSRPGIFQTKQGAYAPFNPTAMMPQLSGNPRALSGGPSGELAAYGVRDRRLVIVPVVRCADMPPGSSGTINVQGWACGLLTSPIRDSDQVLMEYLGPARDSPCVGRGLPGRASVPRLVR